MPGKVIGPRAPVANGQIAEPGAVLGDALDPLPAALRVGHAQVGIEDDAQPPGRAELRHALLAGERVQHGRTPPPAFLAEHRLKPRAELAERGSLGQRLVHRAPDVLENV